MGNSFIAIVRSFFITRKISKGMFRNKIAEMKCHAPKPDSCSNPTSRNVNLGLVKIFAFPRIRVCEDNKIPSQQNISQRLTWRCDPEPVAFGFRVAHNLSGQSCLNNIHTQTGTNMISKYTELTVTR